MEPLLPPSLLLLLVRLKLLRLPPPLLLATLVLLALRQLRGAVARRVARGAGAARHVVGGCLG